MRASWKHRLNTSLEIHILRYSCAAVDTSRAVGNGRSNCWLLVTLPQDAKNQRRHLSPPRRPHFQMQALAAATAVVNMAVHLFCHYSPSWGGEAAYSRKTVNSRSPHSTRSSRQKKQKLTKWMLALKWHAQQLIHKGSLLATNFSTAPLQCAINAKEEI